MASIASTMPLPINANADHTKRKLEEDSTAGAQKRTKMLGPFIMDDDDDDDDRMDSLYGGLQDSSVTENTSLGLPLSGTNSSFTSSHSSLFSHVEPPQNSNTASSSATRRANAMKETLSIRSCSGKVTNIKKRNAAGPVSYESLIAARSEVAAGRAKKSYYGIDIHTLLDEAAKDAKEKNSSPALPSVKQSIEAPAAPLALTKPNLLWTEKYRARKFKDLIGDDRTHRSVLRWVKGWDKIVFPNSVRSKPKPSSENEFEEKIHRKVLLLTGPPGLGKTTLAHVCAKQAGYEVLEINASDERSKNVVKGRIKDAVGTENVKGMTVDASGNRRRGGGKPICVVVDEVDGVVSGSGGGGEGGFIKALIDLVMIDQRNANKVLGASSTGSKKGKKGDTFRLLRPLILICNDVYHPSLRPLRSSSIAEIIHVRQAPIERVVQRMREVFEKEGIACDGDGVRRLCEASWGLSSTRNRRSNNRGVGEGDLRGVLVAGEWIAQKLRAGDLSTNTRLSRKWVEQQLLSSSERDGSSSRGLGRGGTRDIVERVFLDAAGFPDPPVSAQTFHDPLSRGDSKVPVGVSDLRKRHAITRLREMVDAAGDYDRCITDCFLAYPNQTYQDDTILSKPNAAYDWLHFHDLISSKVYSNQDWELTPYLSQSTIAFHHLFASSNRQNWGNERNKTENDEEEEEHPFSGPRSDFAAFEAERQNKAILTGFQSAFSAPVLRTFRSTESIATELIPNMMRMLVPEIKPVVIGGGGGQRAVASVRKESERALVRNAVRVMSGMGITFEDAMVENETGTYSGRVYRMEPPLDNFTAFSKVKGTSLASTGASVPVRYAVRQVLQQEYEKELLRRRSEAQQARLNGGAGPHYLKANINNNNPTKENNDDGIALFSKIPRLAGGPKRDFFGRVIVNDARPGSSSGPGSGGGNSCGNAPSNRRQNGKKEKVSWISYHEGFSNAVRKRITMKELLSGL
ncbi:hypothetical protein AJ80_05577 [Polytolypa hystricis UAMH7299]|uniref:AAA+ ATPase domain-containing protein n=1 Tax=Polytolypa hystricis (strain UAMH7299) TaxID=1447883 RepID=A0A2B7Y2Y6_POLH7|nr:hypothetical protein AJ80_05577 [Polytolypa hystricis UAMH7299]